MIAAAPALGRHASVAAQPARVVICDDSVLIRSAIARMLETDPGIQVVARVGDGAQAIEAVRRHDAEIVVLDIEMPVMDGLTALPLLLRADPGLRVIMASTLTTRGAGIALQALRLGAADYVPKPSALRANGDTAFRDELIAKVKGLARLKRAARPGVARTAPVCAPAPALRLRHGARLPPMALAIGSSTGGPQALFSLVQGLGAGLGMPVFITQHMPATFTPILAEHLTKLGGMPCSEARDGEAAKRNHIYLAPGDKHMLVSGSADALVLKLSFAPPENFCRPSVDPMLRSLTEAAQGRVLMVMLTGMGQDGLAGTEVLIRAGGAAIAQDEATSVVWGMPGAIARAGLCQSVLPIHDIADAVRRLARGGRC